MRIYFRGLENADIAQLLREEKGLAIIKEEEISWEMRRSDYAIGRDKLDVKEYLKWKYVKVDFSCKKCTYFPKHLEYNIDKFGYPILNHHHAKGENEKAAGLAEFLKARHNLPSNKRVLVG